MFMHCYYEAFGEMATVELALWLHAIRETVTSYRRMIDTTIAQLTDTELRERPAHAVNSVAIILRHLGGKCGPPSACRYKPA